MRFKLNPRKCPFKKSQSSQCVEDLRKLATDSATSFFFCRVHDFHSNLGSHTPPPFHGEYILMSKRSSIHLCMCALCTHTHYSCQRNQAGLVLSPFTLLKRVSQRGKEGSHIRQRFQALNSQTKQTCDYQRG